MLLVMNTQKCLEAIRAGCAEAKVEEVDRARRVLDAIRAGCAEAKLSV